MYSFSRTEGWYDGRPVAAGSTPSKLISAKSSASTKTSITRTGLLSSMKSSRHSGKSDHCPRSASSTKRLIRSPAESRGNHNTGTAFLHSQGHSLPSPLIVPGTQCPLRPVGDQIGRAAHEPTSSEILFGRFELEAPCPDCRCEPSIYTAHPIAPTYQGRWRSRETPRAWEISRIIPAVARN